MNSIDTLYTYDSPVCKKMARKPVQSQETVHSFPPQCKHISYLKPPGPLPSWVPVLMGRSERILLQLHGNWDTQVSPHSDLYCADSWIFSTVAPSPARRLDKTKQNKTGRFTEEITFCLMVWLLLWEPEVQLCLSSSFLSHCIGIMDCKSFFYKLLS